MLDLVLRALFALDDLPAPEVSLLYDDFTLDWHNYRDYVSAQVLTDGRIQYSYCIGRAIGTSCANLNDEQSLRKLNSLVLKTVPSSPEWVNASG